MELNAEKQQTKHKSPCLEKSKKEKKEEMKPFQLKQREKEEGGEYRNGAFYGREKRKKAKKAEMELNAEKHQTKHKSLP